MALVSDMRKSKCDEKKTKTLEDVFILINQRHVKMKNNSKKNNNAILYSVLEEFFNKMGACNKLFSNLKPKLAYLGSYFEGLRVGQPTEYDINVILTLHLNYNKIILDAMDVQDGYTSIKMPAEFQRLSKTPVTANKGFKDTELWCDSSHRLSVLRFKSWMQSVVDAALNTLPIENGKKILKVNDKAYRIEAKISGPANTLSIFESEDKIIDVDLVPTLVFQLPKLPINSKIDFKRVIKTNMKDYFVVPKPNASDFSWRLAFPFQERFYMYDKGNMKSTIKILKLLRDIQGFTKLASYYIKTLFLWEAAEKDDVFWKNNSLSYLVIYMLKKLQECLLVKTIRNFWCPDHNLIDTIKMETCQNWNNRLSNIINDIEQNKKTNPDIVLKYFTNSKSTKRN